MGRARRSVTQCRATGLISAEVVVSAGHAGNLAPAARAADPGFARNLADAGHRHPARGAGGDATLFIAASGHESMAAGRSTLKSPALEQIHVRLRQAFDPAGIFNPGRLDGIG